MTTRRLASRTVGAVHRGQVPARDTRNGRPTSWGCPPPAVPRWSSPPVDPRQKGRSPLRWAVDGASMPRGYSAAVPRAPPRSSCWSPLGPRTAHEPVPTASGRLVPAAGPGALVLVARCPVRLLRRVPPALAGGTAAGSRSCSHAGALGLFLLLLLRIRAQRKGLVRTLHNAVPHDDLPAVPAALVRLCDRWTTGWITMSEVIAPPSSACRRDGHPPRALPQLVRSRTAIGTRARVDPARGPAAPVQGRRFVAGGLRPDP